MRCPYCDCEDTHVKDSRPAEDNKVTRRRRECGECGARFSTLERVALRNLMVKKSDNNVEPFNREKLCRSIQVAMRKRKIDADGIEKIVSSLVRKMEMTGNNTISSKSIGENVMQNLARIDPVAYVRFASVYKDFQDVTDFEDFLTLLKPDEKPEGEDD